MKSYIKINIALLVFLFLLSACEDNFEIDDTEITLEEPTELESTLVNGRVTNEDGEPLANADIKIFHGDIPIELTTDDDGRYATELPADNSHVLIQAYEEDYIASAIDKRKLNEDVVINDIKMQSRAGSIYPDDAILINPNDTATLRGQIVDSDGTPLEDVWVLLFDIASSTIRASDFTDVDGNYSFTAAPFEDLSIFAILDCGPGIARFSIDLGTEDLDVGTYTSQFDQREKIILSGFVTDCNTGQGLVSGQITITTQGTILGSVYSTSINNGVYNITINNCEDYDCYDLEIKSDLIPNAEIKEDCLSVTGETIVADYELCE